MQEGGALRAGRVGDPPASTTLLRGRELNPAAQVAAEAAVVVAAPCRKCLRPPAALFHGVVGRHLEERRVGLLSLDIRQLERRSRPCAGRCAWS